MSHAKKQSRRGNRSGIERKIEPQSDRESALPIDPGKTGRQERERPRAEDERREPARPR